MDRERAVVRPHPLQTGAIILATYVAILVLGDLVLPRPPTCPAGILSPKFQITQDLATVSSAADNYALEHGRHSLQSIEPFLHGVSDILATLFWPWLGQEPIALEGKVPVDIKAIRFAVDAHAEANKRWPTSLDDLVRSEPGRRPYLNRLPLDP